MTMFFLKVSAVHMCIDLSRRDVRVSQHLLNGNEVGSTLEKMRGEAVPERVRRNPLPDAGITHVPSEDLPRAHPAERPAVLVEEHDALGPATVELRPTLTKVSLQHPDRTAS